MTPNARRLIANAICARLRDNGRGKAFKWDRTREHAYISGAHDPPHPTGLAASGYPPLLPTHELTRDVEFIDFELLADPALGTPDMIGALARTDHDAHVQSLHPLDQALYSLAITHRTSLPFHVEAGRMRWASKRFPALAMQVLLELTRHADITVLDPLDVADVFYERQETHIDLGALLDSVDAGTRK